MSAQQQQHLRMTLARPANPLARRHVAPLAQVVVAVAPPPTAPTAPTAVVPPPPPQRVRVPRIQHCSFCFSNDGHNIGRCTHIDVEYLYWEMMYFYRYYGEHFLCNNLSVLFQPTEVHALLNYRLVKNIPLLNEANMWERMIVDVMHSPVVSARYDKLHKKIISMSSILVHHLNYGRMDVVEPVLYETIRAFEHDIGERIDYSTILTGYHHTFTRNRHARFRRYDYDVEYTDSIPIDPRELIAFRNQYNPPPMFGNHDAGSYGFARMHLVTMESVNSTVVPRTELSGEQDTETVEEQMPEWMTRNVTQRRGRTTTFEDMTVAIEELAAITRLFEDTLKNAQPEAEVKVVEESYEKMKECIECPICMVEIKHSESVSLRCCVYSFCSDCYSNQYLTKEHRVHNCMMCRAPFSQIEVYEESIAEKLKAKCPATILQTQYYYPDDLPERTERDDDGHYGLPMTLAELL
jgi:hypothetical protein